MNGLLASSCLVSCLTINNCFFSPCHSSVQYSREHVPVRWHCPLHAEHSRVTTQYSQRVWCPPQVGSHLHEPNAVAGQENNRTDVFGEYLEVRPFYRIFFHSTFSHTYLASIRILAVFSYLSSKYIFIEKKKTCNDCIVFFLLALASRKV